MNPQETGRNPGAEYDIDATQSADSAFRRVRSDVPAWVPHYADARQGYLVAQRQRRIHVIDPEDFAQ